MEIGKLYEKLRELVSDAYTIVIHDRVRRQGNSEKAEVTIQHYNNRTRWTNFQGTSIADALQRAIQKFEHPEQDYTDLRGHLWKANEGSCYNEEHIRGMLREEH